MGTLDDGVYWSDAATNWAHISQPEGLLYPRVLSLCIDREDCLWVGTYQDGLNRVRRQFFDVFVGSEGATVQSVCEDRRGGCGLAIPGNGTANGSITGRGRASSSLPTCSSLRTCGTIWGACPK